MRLGLFAGMLIASLPFTTTSKAHVTLTPDQATAGYIRTALRIPHGCGSSATVAIRIKVPATLLSIKPQAKPGWTITIIMRALGKPTNAPHGKTVTEVVDEIVWRGGPLSNDHFDEFGLSLYAPAEEATTLWFPTVQECEQGESRWTEIPTKGQAWDDLPMPAPFLRLIPAAEKAK